MDSGKPIKQVENPAVSPLASVVAAQGAKLDHLTTEVDTAFNVVQKEIYDLRQASHGTVAAISKLSEQLTALTNAIVANAAQPAGQNPAPPIPNYLPPVDPALAPFPGETVREPNLPCPKVYEGDLSQCCGFVTQCELVFRHQPSRFPTGDARVAFVVSLLTGRALDWAVATLNSDAMFSTDYHRFITEFRLVFDHPPDGTDSASRLHSISQGTRSVAEFAVEFRILAAKSQWGDEALKSAFRRGLSDTIKDLILRDRPSSLAELISLALKVDDRLRERRIEKSSKFSSVLPKTPRYPQVQPRDSSVVSTPSASLGLSPSGEPEPMQLGRSRLTQAVREQRMQNRLCLYCGKSGHFIQACDVRPKDPSH